MRWLKNRLSSPVTKYRIRRVVFISLAWAIIDLVLYLRNVSIRDDIDYPYQENGFFVCMLRTGVVFCISLLICWVLFSPLKIVFRKRSMLTGWIAKSILLLAIGLGASVLIFYLHYVAIKKQSFAAASAQLHDYFFYTSWATDGLLFWLVMLLSAQIFVEIDQKYSPGVFWEVLTGKYLRPRNEKRIIMFLDLKDSTPIAEQLGHEKYFLFIKDFIYYVSAAVLENNGMIYQYVGDEVVVTWPYRKSNILKSLNAVIESRKAIQRKSDYFRREYEDIVPEFRVGLHAGDVTIGEIGVIKKDIAISGEAMNVAARIRSACNELNQKFIVSKEYFDSGILQSWQGENLGEVSLKGVDESIQLYALKI
jgi:adenylate cyclase